MSSQQEPGGASEDREAAFAASLTGRDHTLEAVHELESALGKAAPGREDRWRREVVNRLRALEGAVGTEREESQQPDSLLSMIARDYPRRFGSRIRQLREQHEDIVRQLQSLREQLARQMPGEGADAADLRQRVGWVIQAIRHRRGRESDLVYEAITMDLGGERPEDPPPATS